MCLQSHCLIRQRGYRSATFQTQPTFGKWSNQFTQAIPLKRMIHSQMNHCFAHKQAWVNPLKNDLSVPHVNLSNSDDLHYTWVHKWIYEFDTFMVFGIPLKFKILLLCSMEEINSYGFRESLRELFFTIHLCFIWHITYCFADLLFYLS